MENQCKEKYLHNQSGDGIYIHDIVMSRLLNRNAIGNKNEYCEEFDLKISDQMMVDIIKEYDDGMAARSIN